MQALDGSKKKLLESRPVEWGQLPDFPLYMDQVVSYMPRQVLALDGEEKLTPAMINNYIKEGLLPRAQGKRYMREHIAYLTAICVLKQVLTVKELGKILPGIVGEANVEEYYAQLLGVLDSELTESGKLIDAQDGDERDLSELALHLAVSAYCRQYLCKKIIESLPDREESQSKK